MIGDKQEEYNDVFMLVLLVNIFSIFLFFIIWNSILGFGILRERLIWFIPIVGYLLTIFINLAIDNFVIKEYANYKTIKENINYIMDSAIKIIPILSILVAIPFLIQKNSFPIKAFQLAAIGFLYLSIGVLPHYWSENLKTLFIIKNLKSSLYHQSIFWFIASFISIGFWLRII